MSHTYLMQSFLLLLDDNSFEVLRQLYKNVDSSVEVFLAECEESKGVDKVPQTLLTIRSTLNQNLAKSGLKLALELQRTGELTFSTYRNPETSLV